MAGQSFSYAASGSRAIRARAIPAVTPPARGNVRGRLPKAARKGETSGSERINLIVHAGSGDSRQRGADAVQCRDGKDGKSGRGVIHLNRAGALGSCLPGVPPIALPDVSRHFPNHPDHCPCLYQRNKGLMGLSELSHSLGRNCRPFELGL